MQIFIRLREGQEDKLSKILNYTYKPKQPMKICLTAIPPFIKDPVCHICKTRADYMQDDCKLVCAECVNEMIKGMTELQKKEDTTFPLTADTLKKIKFEWSTDRERWYNIRGGSFKPKDMDAFLAKVKDSFISGKFLIAEGEYEKETKMMTIFN
jgi:hypothetical protein